MTELIQLVVSYISIWVPALVATIGTVAAILAALGKTKAAIAEFKKDDTMKQLSADLKKALSDNAELKQQQDIIIDELKKVENYRKELNKK